MVEEVPQYADGTLAWEQSTTWHYEPDSFVPLAKQSHGQAQLHYIVTDHLGTPRELVTEDGTPVWQQQYSVWGKALHDSNTTNTTAANDVPIDCDLRFQGQYHDAESGLHYNYNRYYDPNAAQYLSSDPIGLLGGMRSQGYVENSNKWIDPLGLAKQDCPNAAVVKRMGEKDFKSWIKEVNHTDCFDIAEELEEVAKGKGEILEIRNKDGSWLNNVLEFGERQSFVDHFVFADANYVYDPRYSKSPIKRSAYLLDIKSNNPNSIIKVY